MEIHGCTIPDSGVVANRVGTKVLIDLNSIDDKVAAAPNVADTKVPHYPHKYKKQKAAK